MFCYRTDWFTRLLRRGRCADPGSEASVHYKYGQLSTGRRERDK